MNELGAEGWDYVRADALPCDERSGLTGVKTSYHNVLVFRRVIVSAAEGSAAVGVAASAQQPVIAVPKAAEAPEGAKPAESAKVPAPSLEQEEGPTPALGPAK